jgi:S1/P1 Nuclease
VQYGAERDYALGLVRPLSDSETVGWRDSSAEDWANESYGIARHVIYKRLPGAVGTLTPSYHEEMLPIVDQQLQRAGVRLAELLNKALVLSQNKL